MKRSRRIGYLTKEGFRNVWVNRLMSVASVAVLMSCLVMLGIAFMLIVNVQSIMGDIESQNVVMVYLEEDATETEVETAEREILALDNVKKCEYIDKDTAFKQQIEDLGTDATYFEGVENPLPDLFKVSISDMTRFESTVSALKNINNVDTVRDNKDIASTLIQIRKTVTYVSFGIIVVLLIISLFIIANTVRITMFSRRLEINIMKSVGATNWFIRWPFIVEGMVLGIIAGILSTGVVWGVYKLIDPTVTSLFTMISRDFSVEPFTSYVLYILAAFIIIGIFSGGIGSLISIQKYLRERGGIIYEEDE
ncbi:MAG: permease-like cell division protein FtsX [Clostridia bacterium]|nr:permease-like cell division protein FtsX [Clostridia bacterium]